MSYHLSNSSLISITINSLKIKHGSYFPESRSTQNELSLHFHRWLNKISSNFTCVLCGILNATARMKNHLDCVLRDTGFTVVAVAYLALYFDMYGIEKSSHRGFSLS